MVNSFSKLVITIKNCFFMSIIILSLIWLLLLGEIDVFLDIPIISVLVILFIGLLIKLLPKIGKLRLSFIYYFFWLMVEVLKASLAVTKIIWSKKMVMEPHMDYVSTKQKKDLGKVIFANSITLTPGTVTIDMNDKLLVHTLTKDNIIDLNNGDMDKKILKIC